MTLKARKILLIAVLSMGGLAIAVPAVLLFAGIRQFSHADQGLALSLRTLGLYYGKQPFPSEKNIRIVRENTATLERWFQELMGRLREGQAPVSRMTPSWFMSQLDAARNKLQPAAKEQGVTVPTGFGFGFERYAEGTLPAPQNVARLTHQLALVDALTRVLIEGRVKEVVAVRREEFEGGSTPQSGRPDLPASESPAPGEPAAAEAAPTGELYSKEHFSLEFRARERAWWQVLNSLAAGRTFIVVTSAELRRESPDILESQTAEGARPARAAAPDDPFGAETPPPAPASEPVKPAATKVPQRSERVVSGPALEKPMLVKLELDVYTFHGK